MAALSDATLAAISRLSVGTPVTDASDFTALTPAQVAAKYELASYGGDESSYVYAPGADGDYVALDHDDPPVTDLGLWACGAFVNELPGSLVGESLPAFFNVLNIQNATYTYGREILGLPAFRVQGEASAAGYFPNFFTNPVAQAAGSSLASTHLVRVNAATVPYVSSVRSMWSGVGAGGIVSPVRITKAIVDPDTEGLLYLAEPTIAVEIGAGVDIDFGPAQLVKLPYNPPVLALSSGTTTTHIAAITQREVAVWKPFVVVIEATTGEDTGAHQVFYSVSRSADELIEIYRATSTDQITLHVRSGGTSYTDALGSVADNTAFSVAINVFASFAAASLDGGTVQVLTAPKPSGVLTLESIGCKHNGTLQCNGPIAECTLIHPAVWTDAQLEAA